MDRMTAGRGTAIDVDSLIGKRRCEVTEPVSCVRTVDRNRRNRDDPHDQGVRSDRRPCGNGMGAACGRPHSGRASRQRPRGRYRLPEALARNLDLSIAVAADAIRKHWGHRKQIALHTRRHLPRGRLANPDKSRNYRQAPEHGLQSPSLQSV